MAGCTHGFVVGFTFVCLYACGRVYLRQRECMHVDVCVYMYVAGFTYVNVNINASAAAQKRAQALRHETYRTLRMRSETAGPMYVCAYIYVYMYICMYRREIGRAHV